MYFPRNWAFDSALSKLRNFMRGLNPPNHPHRYATDWKGRDKTRKRASSFLEFRLFCVQYGRYFTTRACVHITAVSEASLKARGYVSFLDPCPTLHRPLMHVVEDLSGWNLTLVPIWSSVRLFKQIRWSIFSTSRTSLNLPYFSKFLLCG
jgi:hypothetical protein